jgi:hypothetical protein
VHGLWLRFTADATRIMDGQARLTIGCRAGWARRTSGSGSGAAAAAPWSEHRWRRGATALVHLSSPALRGGGCPSCRHVDVRVIIYYIMEVYMFVSQH